MEKEKEENEMIIRKLRKDEKYKFSSVMSAAFSYSADIEQIKKEPLDEEVYGAFCDDGEAIMAAISAKDYISYFSSNEVGMLGIAGVSTFPAYRRNGCIREIFTHLFGLASQRAWTVSALYPFSFNYYRQFGYERAFVCESLSFPISGLSHIPRNQDGILYTDISQLADLKAAYNDNAKQINGMLRREDCSVWSTDPYLKCNYTYIFYNDCRPCGYICVRTKGDTLTVLECCYDSVHTLERILGFIRLYDGQVCTVVFCHTFAQGTVEALCGEFRGFSRKTHDGPMIRVLDAQELFKLNKYPQAEGSFTVRIHDAQIKKNDTCFSVSYSGNTLHIKRDAEEAPCVECPIQAFSLLVYGAYDAPLDEWCDVHSVTLNGDTSGFFRAFPRRMINMYDAF